MIKLVLTDMDNTLVPFGRPHVSLRTLVAIHAVQAVGVEFGPATGRDLVELSPFFLGDASYYRTGVISNGKKVYLHGECKALHLLDREALAEASGIVRQYPNCFMGIYPYHTSPDNPVFCVGDHVQVQHYTRKFRFRAIAVDEVPRRRIVGATIACPLEDAQIEELLARVREAVPALDVVRSQPEWCDILPHGVSKASGLDELLGFMGITRDEVVFFGDAENDLEIMRAVPNSCAVANATPAAAATARWHVNACADDGVAQALEEIAQSVQTGMPPAFMRD